MMGTMTGFAARGNPQQAQSGYAGAQPSLSHEGLGIHTSPGTLRHRHTNAVVPGLVPGTHWRRRVAMPADVCGPARRKRWKSTISDFARMGRSEEHTSELQSLMRIS